MERKDGKKKRRGHLTPWYCLRVARTFDNPTALSLQENGVYKKILHWNKEEEGVKDFYFSHMIDRVDEGAVFTVYWYKFDSKYAYVGLTKRLRNRRTNHVRGRNKRLKNTIANSREYTFEYIGGLTEKKAQGLEVKKYYELVVRYEMLQDENFLGQLGARQAKYTYETAKEECLKYTSRVQLRRENKPLWKYIARHGWVQELMTHGHDHRVEEYTDKEIDDMCEDVLAKKYLRDVPKNIQELLRSRGKQHVLDQLIKRAYGSNGKLKHKHIYDTEDKLRKLLGELKSEFKTQRDIRRAGKEGLLKFLRREHYDIFAEYYPPKK